MKVEEFPWYRTRLAIGSTRKINPKGLSWVHIRRRWVLVDGYVERL